MGRFKGIPIVRSGAKFETDHGFTAIKDGVKQNRRASERPIERKPPWIKAKLPVGEGYAAMKRNVREHRLATVCEESMCPNIRERWNAGTATIMVVG